VNEILKESSNINEAVNVRDLAGWTPLHEACNQGNLDIVKILIEHNADMNALGYQNNTPLHEAALNTKFDCCKYLLEMGANKSIRNQFGVLASDFVKSMPEFVTLFNSFENQQNEQPIQNEEQSLDQSVLNTTKSSTQKKILFGTGMNEEGKCKLKSLADMLKITVAKEMSNNGNSKEIKFNIFTKFYIKAIIKN
jgi:ankyrin repeat protein